MRIQKKEIKNKKIIIIAFILFLLGGISYSAYAATNKVWPFSTKDSNSQSSDNTTGINYNPPTQQEVDSSQDGKKDSTDATKEETPSNKLSLIVTYAGLSDDKSSIEINAYTADVIEGTGVCVATLINDSASVVAQSQASVDASSSICQPILIPLSKFNTSGNWKLTVKYTSPTHTGVSQAQNIEVQL